MPQQIIRASEIGSYLYCRRAWKFRKEGVESANRAELAAGTELHQQHGRKAIASGLTRAVGVILFLAALVVLTAYITSLLIPPVLP
jgi:VIT1/CCC1 family predicted Fe2+/Mn2+ transporter